MGESLPARGVTKRYPSSPYVMGHDTQLVQGGLSIEENNIIVGQMTFHNIANLELLGSLPTIRDKLEEPEGMKQVIRTRSVEPLDLPFGGDVVGTWMNVRTVDHTLS